MKDIERYVVAELRQKFGSLSLSIRNGCDEPFSVSYFNARKDGGHIKDSLSFYEVICQPVGSTRYVLGRHNDFKDAQIICNKINSSNELEDGTIATVNRVELDFSIEEIFHFCDEHRYFRSFRCTFAYILLRRSQDHQVSEDLRDYLFREFMKKHCPNEFHYLNFSD
ncbi:hypothetical protein UFOVP1361_48 [uncultured Caudovirales phage]|uniref:Uncharacterized protein n=1 Tax=uncultured Caudovirales phage TaxID=2100421 RepID=A0A6J5S4E1_9CAUD|nr:hypothetical protein UFOVP1361_48 [uncultured Caudovirales phage]